MSRFVFALTAALVLGAAAAAAHALPQTTSPAADSTVRTAPREVTIVFSEAVEPRFSRIEVADAHGARVDVGEVRVAPGDARRLSVVLRPIGPGRYTVTWHAVAVDAHKTQGRFTFTVAP
jgi:methionine-rich copper-binding protein CopC